MALVRRESQEGLISLRHEMDRLFDNFARGPWRGFEMGEMELAIEVSDTKNAVVVKAQVPGVDKKDLQVNITDDMLTLKGEMKEEEEKEEKNYTRREIRYGAFTRSVHLPTAVQGDKAKAKLKDGVLEIRIPKSKEAEAKQIPITA